MNPRVQLGTRLGLSVTLLLIAARAALAQDVLVNDRTGDPAGSLQHSPSVAALGDTALVAWTYRNSSVASLTLRCALTFNGGATFNQLVSPPLPAGWTWRGDPKVSAHVADGDFYFAGRATGSVPITGAPGAIFVALGRPDVGPTLLWYPAASVDLLTNAATIQADGDNLDIAVHPGDGRVMIVYSTDSTLGPDSIRFRHSQDDGVTWSNAVDLFTDLPQTVVNPRLTVTSDGTVVVGAVLVEYTGLDPRYSMVSTSTVDFQNFVATQSVATGGYPSDAPAGSATTRPGMALAANPVFIEGLPSHLMLWSAGFDAATAPLPSIGSSVRLDEGPDDSTLTAPLFVPGDILQGSVSPAASDVDFWAFQATPGTRYVFAADSGASVTPPNPYMILNMHIVGPDGRSWLASRTSAFVQEGVYRTVLGFVPPISGTYWLRLSTRNSFSGTYRIRTAVDTRPPVNALDHGDNFLSGFQAGGWDLSPRRLFEATEIGFHESGPAMGYAGDGRLWIARYDWLYQFGAALSRLRIVRYNATLNYLDSRIASGATTDWMGIVAPRPEFWLGRSAAIASSARRTYVAWTDGRNRDSDIYLRSIRTDVGLTHCPGNLAVYPGENLNLQGTVFNENDLFQNTAYSVNQVARNWPSYTPVSTFYVPAGSSALSPFALQVPDTAAAGLVQVTRTFSTDGGTIGVCTCELTVHATTGVGDRGAALALQPVLPNPAFGSARIAWELPRAGSAVVEVLDAAGRRVREIAAGPFAAGRHERVWGGDDESGRSAAPGLYWVRMRVDGKSLTQSFVRLK